MSGLVLSLIACSILADEPVKAPLPGPTVIVTQADESKFPEITVSFEVRKPDQGFILDAIRDEFRVTEDGQERPILRFDAPMSTEIRPTTVVLVVDHSGSMRTDDKMESLKRAVATFLEGLPAGSRVAVIAFSNEIKVICPFTSERDKVQAGVEELEANGGTRYYDAVTAALELLAEETGRRAILALTDGQDTESKTATLKSTIAYARKLGLPVHTLGLGNEKEQPTREASITWPETRPRSGKFMRRSHSGSGRATHWLTEPIARFPTARSGRSRSSIRRRSRPERPPILFREWLSFTQAGRGCSWFCSCSWSF
jgi:hypothetical protein